MAPHHLAFDLSWENGDDSVQLLFEQVSVAPGRSGQAGPAFGTAGTLGAIP